jgi:hypothetical protein
MCRVQYGFIQTLTKATRTFIAFALKQDDESKVVHTRLGARRETLREKGDVCVR